MVNGLTAYSSKPFIVTFTSPQSINSSSFATNVDFTAGSSPWRVAIGDLDGDGKPDLVVVNNSSNTISVYRNIITSGTITSNSFAAKVDFVTGSSPISIALGDLDGDGKLDIVVGNLNSPTVSVLHNTSISGSITSSSFAAKVDFTVGTYPYSVAIGDVDGDGKPDIVVNNEGSSTVSVLRNTSIEGSITSSSFATKVDFTTGSNSYSVAIGDIDGDGKPDLAIANYVDNIVSVYRNTSTIGIISFAAKVDFTTTDNLGALTPWNVAIGDVDGDGKPDLVVSNVGGNTTISVLRNTSTIGSVSFAAKVDFTAASRPSNIAIGDIDGDGKPDLAVANSYLDSTVSVFRNTSTIGNVSFAAKVDFKTASPPLSVAIDDIDGDGKPDIVVAIPESNIVSIFRNVIGNGNTAPAAPQNLTAIAGNAQVQLKWNKNTEADFLKYRVYMGSDSTTLTLKDSSTSSILDTTKLISSLTNGTTYYFRVSALDSARLESLKSIAASATPMAGSVSVISLSATTIAFGSVTSGRTTTKSLVITNTGTAALTGTVSVTANAGFSINKTSINITAGGKDSVLISFSPTAIQNYNATLTITHNAAGSPSTVTLSGTGVASPASVISIPTALTFGSVTAGSSLQKTLTIGNTGNAVLTGLLSIPVNSGYTLNSTSLSVASGSTQDFIVTFSPLAAQNYNTTLTITHNAVGSPSTITLSGTGITSPGNPLISVSPSSVLVVSNGNFVSATVGNVVVTNNGTTTLNGALSYSGSSALSVSPTTLNIAAGSYSEYIYIHFLGKYCRWKLFRNYYNNSQCIGESHNNSCCSPQSKYTPNDHCIEAIYF